MTDNEAIIEILCNFGHYDGDIRDNEITKIKKAAQQLNINDVDIDSRIKHLKIHANKHPELMRFVVSISILDNRLMGHEKGPRKLEIFEKALEVIKENGNIINSQKYKADFLAGIWRFTRFFD